MNAMSPALPAPSEESLHVLDGEIDLCVGNRRVRLSAGMSRTLPVGVAYGFTSVGGQSHRLLVVLKPGL